MHLLEKVVDGVQFSEHPPVFGFILEEDGEDLTGVQFVLVKRLRVTHYGKS